MLETELFSGVARRKLGGGKTNLKEVSNAYAKGTAEAIRLWYNIKDICDELNMLKELSSMQVSVQDTPLWKDDTDQPVARRVLESTNRMHRASSRSLENVRFIPFPRLRLLSHFFSLIVLDPNYIKSHPKRTFNGSSRGGDKPRKNSPDIHSRDHSFCR